MGKEFSKHMNKKKLGYYSLDPDINLLNTNFATGENSFLNEHVENSDEWEDEENRKR